MTVLEKDVNTAPDHIGGVNEMVEEAAKAAWECPQTNHDPSDISWAWILDCEKFDEDDTAERYRHQARSALESLGVDLTVLAALRSGEWVAVPKEPTEAMQAAGENADVMVRNFYECPHATIRSECYSGNPACEDGEDNNHNCADAIFRQVHDDGESVGVYRAMLSAAPKTPEDMR